MTKNKSLLKTDKEIIDKCLRLYNEIGPSKEYLDAIDNLAEQICPEKQALWKQIIEGQKYSVLGDGLEMPPSYKHTEHYGKAYEIFTGVEKKIKDKESVLYVYIEKMRITALALSRTKDINAVIKLYDKNIIDKFWHSKDKKILAQVASAMVDKSFVLWEVNKENITYGVLQQSKKIEDAIIKRFLKYKEPEIQVYVAKCFRNKANTIGKEIERNEPQGIEIRKNIIKKYKYSRDDMLRVQVAGAMLCVASSLSELNAVEAVKKKHEVYRDSKNYEDEIMATYSELIDNFQDSDNIDIQKTVAAAMGLKGDFLHNKGQPNAALLIYEELIDKFRNNKSDIIKHAVCDALFYRSRVLRALLYQNPERKEKIFKNFIGTYTEIINILEGYEKSAWNYEGAQEYIALAKTYIANILLEQEKYDAALNLYTELADKFSLYKDTNIRFLALQKMAEIFMIKANIALDKELVEQAIKVRTKLVNLYKNDRNLERQEEVAKIMIKRATNEFSIYNCHKAIDYIQEVIDKYSTKKYQWHVIFKEIVNDAMAEKNIMEGTLPVLEIFNFNKTNKSYIDDMIISISNGSVVPIIGAGLSQFNYPLWKEFLLSIFDMNEKHLKGIDRKEFAKYSCKKQASILIKSITAPIFKNQVKSHFADKDEPQEMLEKQPVWFLPILFNGEKMITTNFDNLIQRVFALHGNIRFVQCTPKDVKKIKDKKKSTTLLYKIHGTVDAFDSLVLSEEEFEETYKKGSPAYNGMVEILNNAEKILFLGCSMEERNDILRFGHGKDDSTAIYAIYPCEDDDNKKTEVVKKLGVEGVNMPILYPPKDNHAYLYHLLYYAFYCIHKGRLLF